MKTNYTMNEIKNAVEVLKRKSIQQISDQTRVDFEKFKHLDEVSFNFKKYKEAVETISVLVKKYSDNGYYSNPVRYDIEDMAYSKFSSNYTPSTNKAINQFNVIINKLKTMRNPDKAVELLGTCGIELPNKITIENVLPIDIEFIKSILPSNKMLNEGK